jgi:hypothetical protein
MLYARFDRITKTTAGPAGEAVVQHSLQTSGHHLRPMNGLAFGEIRAVGKVTMQGPLDNGAWLEAAGPADLPDRPIGVPIEVKNRRQMLYPTHKERFTSCQPP